MSYENAPATYMLATNCAFCSRPLVDGQSAETGVGPVCRKKHMVTDQVSNEARVEGNKLIHKIALLQKGKEVTAAVERLKELGYSHVVERISKRLKKRKAAPIHLSYQGERIYLKTPRVGNEVFESYLGKCRSIPGRRWESQDKANSFPMDQKLSVWKMLQEFFMGREAIGPKGEFTI